MRKRKRYILLLTVVGVAAVIFLVGRMRRVTIPPGSHLFLTIGGSYVDAPPQDWIGRLVGSRRHGLIDLLLTIRKAQADTRIAGLPTSLIRTSATLAPVGAPGKRAAPRGRARAHQANRSVIIRTHPNRGGSEPISPVAP